MTKQIQQLDRVVIRFAGDSGDGMQLTGDRFTSETAQLGNDLSTLPNFPAEIRAPAGTLPGVSSFQLHFADYDILTPGDAPNVLVAMNPAALKANLADLPRGADIIVNTDEFTKRNLAKVGYADEPARGRLARRLRASTRSALTSMTVEALAELDVSKKDAERAKNMFALGLLSWLYNRPTERRCASWSASSPPGPSSSRPTSRRSRPAGTSARPPRTSRSRTRSSRRRCRRAPTATSPATWPCRYGLVAAGAAPGCRSSSAPTRSPRPPTSCTS